MRDGQDATDPLVFDRAGIREVDRRAIEEHGIPGLVLMENAAIGAAGIASNLLEQQDRGKGVVIVCGSGNNGGDGYAMARLLHDAGVAVRLLARSEPRVGSDAETNARATRRMRIPVSSTPEDVDNAALVIDALLGTGLDRPVQGSARELIEAMNATAAPVLAVDIPSGLDADTGQPLGAAVEATATATFVGWKRGFLEPSAASFTGTIHVIDIGVPLPLARSLGLDRPG